MSARRTVRGLAAFATVMAVIGGVPLLLIRVAGSPIPGHMPDWHHLHTVLTRREYTRSELLALVRDLTWLAWLSFSVALITELQAAVRGRLAPRLHLGGVQAIAARLAAVAALSLTAPTGVTLASAGSASAATVIAGAPAHDAVVPRPAGGAELASSTKQVRFVTVSPGDCLWTLAEHYLGDGDRYPEIAALNLGRRMDDGVIFTDPNLIYPGWQLEFPAGLGSAAAGQRPPALPGAGGHHRQAIGRHAGHNTSAPRFRRAHSAAGGAPAATRSPEVTRPSAPGSPVVGRPQPAAAAQSRSEDERRLIAATVGAAAAAVLLAGGVLVILEALRRRQRSRRRPGRRIALPADDAAQRMERTLRAADGRYRPDAAPPPLSLRVALQELAAGLGAAGQEMPEFVGVHLVPDSRSLEVLLARPGGEPPAPFTMAPGRQEMAWQLDLTAMPPEAWHSRPAQVGGLMPGLFTVGTTTDGYLLLDLESMRTAVVRGQPPMTDQFITTVAAELATNQWSGWYDLVLAGPFPEFDHVDRAEHCGSLDEALHLLRLRKRSIDTRLGSAERRRGPSPIRGLRLARPDDEDWGLTLLVSRVPPMPSQLDELVGLAGTPGGIAVLVPVPPEWTGEAPARIDLAASAQGASHSTASVSLDFLGDGNEIVVRTAMLSTAEYQALGSLFAAAATPDDVGQDEPPYQGFVRPPWLPRAAAESSRSDAQDPMANLFAAPIPDDVGQDEPPYQGFVTPRAAAETPRRDIDNTMGSLFAAAPIPDDVGQDEPLHQGFVTPRAAAETPRRGTEEAGLASVAPSLATEAPPAVAAGASDGAALGPLRIGILGPVDISGTEGVISDQQAELVLALALTAPERLSAAALAALLGADPGQPMPLGAVQQLATRTRRALGLTAGGGYYILHDADGYFLSGEAQLDWAEFTGFAQAGLESGDLAQLAAAMDLVRGSPLAGMQCWWLDAALIETINAQVVDTALRLAESQLAAGDTAAAAATAQAGLRADPAAEQLSRILMRAEHAAGNRAGLDSAWDDCHQAIQTADPAGRPQEETTGLYRALSGEDANLPIQVPR